MHHKGWHDAERTRQWLQLLMGPRPPSVQWPRLRQHVAKGQGKGRGPMTKGDGQSRHNPAQPPQRQSPPAVARPVTRSSPDEAAAAAQGRVAAVEAAINALGDSDAAALKFLQEVLKKAMQVANCGPVGERLGACTKFVERARKRLAKADEDLARMQDERAKLDSELAEGVARLEVLRAEAAAVAPTFPAEPQNLAVEVSRMQGVIDNLQSERAQMRGVDAMELAGDQDSRSGCTVALVDEGGAKRPRLEAAAGSGSVV